MEMLPVTAADIKQKPRRNLLLKNVVTYVQSGCAVEVRSELNPFKLRENELGLEGNTLLWGNRVVIPTKLQATLLQSLHESNHGKLQDDVDSE